jgi:hypothetical protein
MGASAPQTLVVDVRLAPANAVTVDALARMQLTARRRGLCLRLDGASPHLLELIAFMGLDNVLGEAAMPEPGS